MPEVQRTKSLDIAQDLQFQQRSWAVQRAGWAMMGLLIAAALLGLLGPGPLSKKTVGNKGDLLSLEYQRFGRFQSPEQLKIYLGPEAVRDGQAQVWLNRGYLKNVQVERIVPEPQQVEAGPDRLTYVFKMSPSNQPTEITFYLQPDHIGPKSGQIGLVDARLSFSQFTYP